MYKKIIIIKKIQNIIKFDQEFHRLRSEFNLGAMCQDIYNFFYFKFYHKKVNNFKLFHGETLLLFYTCLSHLFPLLPCQRSQTTWQYQINKYISYHKSISSKLLNCKPISKKP